MASLPGWNRTISRTRGHVYEASGWRRCILDHREGFRESREYRRQSPVWCSLYPGRAECVSAAACPSRST